MLLSTLFVNGILIAAAFALPAAKGAWRSRRASTTNGTSPRDSPGLGSGSRRSQPSIAGSADLQFSTNWAGAVISEAPGFWKAVTSSFNVPQATPGGVAVWVGIDGNTCQQAILQAGINAIDFNGQPTYQAWWEWFPNPETLVPLAVGPGHTMQVSVQANSLTTGLVTIENLSTGQFVQENVQGPVPLCLQDAEWIVEDFEENGGLVPFANFGTVTFSGAAAITNAGGTAIPGGEANVLDIEQNGAVLTSVLVDGVTVVVSHT
ncbi:peptidase G1 domain-containing protein [Phanerochaete sordida]|uniref:Peptidase G1 domain-containing protein n=1 Tax=Phanerochaete sordida TaxID=48140 RepID=A0A9P3GI23_9APHY|nr:peptidase G1 domain-containing protein [Phanerochaete sordida]